MLFPVTDMVDHIDSSRRCGICCVQSLPPTSLDELCTTLLTPVATTLPFTPSSLPHGFCRTALIHSKLANTIRTNYDNMQAHPQRQHLPHQLCSSPRSPFQVYGLRRQRQLIPLPLCFLRQIGTMSINTIDICSPGKQS